MNDVTKKPSLLKYDAKQLKEAEGEEGKFTIQSKIQRLRNFAEETKKANEEVIFLISMSFLCHNKRIPACKE